MVYLDYAAAYPVSKEVSLMLRDESIQYYNPSSTNTLSRCNMQAIQHVRKKIADLIHCCPEEIYFTSGASESNAWAVDGFLKSYENAVAISTNIEHSSILNNPNVKPLIRSNEKGFITNEAIEATRSEWTENTLIIIQHANNEVGSIQDIKRLRESFPECTLLVDAAQTFAKLDINVKEMGIDMLSASAGKVGGIRGVGFLYLNKDIKIEPIIYGTQEKGFRGGTYFDLGIKAFGLALNTIENPVAISLKRDFLLEELRNIQGLQLIGSVENRLPNNILIKIKGLSIDSQQIVGMLEESGFIVSSGSACHSGEAKLSHVLEAIGETLESAKTVVRITIGEDTNVNDLWAFAEYLKSIVLMFQE